MGYTQKTVELIEPLLPQIQTVIDLGSQNDYRTPEAPYVSEWYKEHGKKYQCYDLNGENGAIMFDLSTYWKIGNVNACLVADIGTSEHVGDHGRFEWQAIYNCWLNKHNLLKLNGYMVNENPKTGNWPGHGFNYYTEDFYRNLEKHGSYKILSIGEHPAMGNITDGWNIYCVLQKIGETFVTLEEFKELGIKQQ